MKPHTDSELSLSFVDVITNGLGSLLVLFFIMALLRDNPDWSRSDFHGEGKGIPVEPFLVLVKLTPEQPPRTDLLKNPKGGPPLVLDNPDNLAYTPEPKSTTGPDFALWYADRPPPGGTQLRLWLPPQHPAGTVWVHRAGKDVAPFTFPANAQSVVLWPREN